MYCKYCGTKLEHNARFCTSCGAQRQQDAVPPEGYGAPVNLPPQRGAAPASAAASPSRKKRSVIAILVAILVILAGFQFMSLGIVGKTATASVTSVRQDRQSYGETSPNPNRYRVQYAFSVGEESYEGSASLIFKQGVSSTQTIQVRYLPYYPAINAPADQTKIMGGLLLTGFGAFLLVMAVQGKAGIRRARRRTKERSVLSDDTRRR
jgi:hypothetical protein